MRLPALRLSLPRPSFDWLEGFDGRRFLLYGLYTVVLFVVFSIANFPHDMILQRALRAFDLGPVQLAVGQARFAWWNGYELRKVALTQRGAPDLPPLLESSSLYLRPGYDGLIRGELSSVLAHGLMYGGAVDASFSRGDGLMHATLQLSDLQIGRYPLIVNLLEEGQIGGVLSGTVSFENRGADPSGGRAAGELEIAGASIEGAKIRGLALPPFTWENLSAKFSVQGSRLDIEELRGDGPCKLSGQGQIVVRSPLADSVLNLRVSVVPGADCPEAVKLALSVVPRPPNARPDAPIVISGTLANPRTR